VSAHELLAAEEPFIVALDELQDPQNLGAIARSAECAGATGLVICERRAAAVTPAVVKASAGAVEHLRIARVRNMADFLGDAKTAGAWCYGADAAAPTAYDEPDYRGGVVLVMGGEGTGLRPRVAKSCDALVALPMRGRTESLNASAAAAVLMYGILQRRAAA
jgi:23S rRNA (guanosine2251-2'-O)-methyltransferase